MAGGYNLGYIDYSKESSSFSIHLPTLNAANIAAQTTLIGDLKTATDAITLGNPSGYSIIANRVTLSGSPAGSVYAQRENKWLVHFTDDVSGVAGTATIPTADLSLLATNSDQADMTNAAVIAFVAAFEAVALSPTGHAVTVTGIEFVGRNS
jgi:hypothetical protein